MKFRFWRKKAPAAPPGWTVKIAARERALRWQIAEQLRRRAAKLSPARLRWYTALFLAAGLTVFTGIGIWAVTMPQKPVDFIVNGAPVVLKKYYDSLRAARPGFEDTMRQLEQIYPAH
jgi:hypothetical protein